MSIRILAAVVITLSVLIAGCGTQPTERTPATEADTVLSLSELERRIGSMLEQARSLPSPEREQQLLNAAELLNQNLQPDWALNILQSIPAAALDDEAFIRYSDQASRAAITTGRYLMARELLADSRLLALPLSATEDVLLSERRATVDSRLGNFDEALSERIRLGRRLADIDDIELNNELIWQDLMSLSTAQLQNLVQAPTQSPQRGWAELALLARDNASDLSAQLAQLERWQRQWQGHPAARHLPTDLQLLNQLVAEQPRQIALLLPQQGRLAGAASAVRDGFLASYYAAPLGATRPHIRQYDTSGDNIESVYQQAIDDGAEMIIGPLSKEHVQTLSTLPLTVPVLALNTLDETAPESLSQTQAEGDLNILDDRDAVGDGDTAGELFAPTLFQFGLAAEDEARQVARFAKLEGYRNAMIIAPDAGWATRSADAFTDQWQALGGQVLSRSTYVGSGEYSDMIKRSLLIDRSEERHRQMRTILGYGTEFEPRRRQDVDMIFLIATPAQARQIKPTLAFHYAGDLPVYATSQIFTGEISATDSDLNGIRFNTLPWQFDHTRPEKKLLSQHTSIPPAFAPLQAMGVDAYHLYSRLPQLHRLSRARLFGATGNLSLNALGQIERELIWARFTRNDVQLLPAVIDQPSE